jgi:prophage DNA circulation protein
MNSSTAQAYFETLTREKTAFEQSARQADADRAIVQSRLQELMTKKEKLFLDSRKLVDIVGQLHNQKVSYSSEKSRLEQVIKAEREALEQCTADTDALVTKERSRQQKFCDNAVALTDELEKLLIQQEDVRLTKLISFETVPLLLAAVQEAQGPVAEMSEAATRLVEVTNKCKCMEASVNDLVEKIKKLRDMALRQQTTANGSYSLAHHGVRHWSLLAAHQVAAIKWTNSHIRSHSSFLC